MKNLLAKSLLAFGFLFHLPLIGVAQVSIQDSLPLRTLDFYLEAGLQNSPLLKDNLNYVSLNQLDSLINIALNKPFVQAVGQTLYAPTGKKWGYDESITNGQQYSGLIQASRNLLYRRNLKIQNRLNSALKDSIVNTLRMNQNDLRKVIIDSYLISFLDYRQMVIYHDLFTILSQQNNILKELLKKAFFNQADYLAFRVDFQQSEINYQTAKIQYLQDLLGLHILCNINDTTLVRLEEPSFTQQPVFSYQDNPYLLRYRFDSLIVERNRRLIDIYYRPQLNLTADAGVNSLTVSNIPNTLGYSFALTFSMPIYNGNQRRYQYQKLDVNQLTIRNYKNQYQTRLALKLRTISEQIRVNQTLLALIEKQNTDAESLLQVSQTRLYSGDLSPIDYLLNVQRYLNIKVSFNQLKVERLRLISEFNYRNW